MPGKPAEAAGLKMGDKIMALSCMRALDALRLLLPPDHQRVKETYETIHHQLSTQYQAAGEPYGRGEEAMWKWLKERAEM